jgi:hypothetical protein
VADVYDAAKRTPVSVGTGSAAVGQFETLGPPKKRASKLSFIRRNKLIGCRPGTPVAPLAEGCTT